MEQNASIRNGLIDAFQKRNFKLLVDPIEQAISCFEQYGRAEPSFNRQAAYFGQCIFSSSIKNDPFVQSITNDDVLTNNIHTSLARSIRYTHTYFVKETFGKLSVVYTHSFRKQFTGHLRSSTGSGELQSI